MTLQHTVELNRPARLAAEAAATEDIGLMLAAQAAVAYVRDAIGVEITPDVQKGVYRVLEGELRDWKEQRRRQYLAQAEARPAKIAVCASVSEGLLHACPRCHCPAQTFAMLCTDGGWVDCYLCGKCQAMILPAVVSGIRNSKISALTRRVRDLLVDAGLKDYKLILAGSQIKKKKDGTVAGAAPLGTGIPALGVVSSPSHSTGTRTALKISPPGLPRQVPGDQGCGRRLDVVA